MKKGASILFVNPSREILLLLRDDRPDLLFPNKWDVPGGHVEADESPEACIIREMREEIEMELQHPELFHVYDMEDRVESVFWQQADLDAAALKVNEGQRLQWFTEESVRDMPDEDIAFHFKGILLDFYQEKPWLRNPVGALPSE